MKFQIKVKKIQKFLVLVLCAISVVGAFGIPLGDPKFIVQAVSLESAFIALAIISLKNFRYAYVPNFVIATIVIIGNTISPKHIEIMTTLHPFYNGVVLIMGGYILQALLLVTNFLSLREYKKLKATQ